MYNDNLNFVFFQSRIKEFLQKRLEIIKRRGLLVSQLASEFTGMGYGKQGGLVINRGLECLGVQGVGWGLGGQVQFSDWLQIDWYRVGEQSSILIVSILVFIRFLFGFIVLFNKIGLLLLGVFYVSQLEKGKCF